MVVLVALCVPGVQAQDYSSSKPESARLDPYGPYQDVNHDWFQQPGGDPPGEEGEAVEEETDTAPLAGADNPTLGIRSELPNFLQPQVNFTQHASADGDFSDARGQGTVSGSVELYKRSARRRFSLEYAGGATVYYDGSSDNRSYHQLRLRQTFQGRRWSLLVGNETSYYPEAPFSFMRTSGLVIGGTFNINGVSQTFSSTFIPVQTIITGRSNRIATASVAQYQYLLNARSSFFVVGAYGIQRYDDPQLIDSDQTQIAAGYQRKLGSKDTIGVSYGLGMFSFSGGLSDVTSHTVEASWGRQLARRLALRVSSGEQISRYQEFGAQQTKVYWVFNGGLLYSMSRSTIGINYNRRMTGGSGVFSGAQADLVQVTFNRRVGRIWSMSTFGGYAHNNGLRNGSSSTTRRTYDSQYGGVRFNRPLGRNRNLYLGYSLSHQNYSTPDCTGGGCSGGQLHHSFQIGLSWVPRSIRLD
jgi:hypothetical protein